MSDTIADSEDEQSSPEQAIATASARAPVESGVAYAISCSGGAVKLPSPTGDGCEVELLWSTRSEAEKWAPILDKTAKVVPLSTRVLIEEFLPALALERRRVGIDWTEEPSETEVEPEVFAGLLHRADLEQTAATMVRAGAVWVLHEREAEPLLYHDLASARPLALLFPSRDLARQTAERLRLTAEPHRHLIGEFLRRVLLDITAARAEPAFVTPLAVTPHVVKPWTAKGLLAPHQRKFFADLARLGQH